MKSCSKVYKKDLEPQIHNSPDIPENKHVREKTKTESFRDVIVFGSFN